MERKKDNKEVKMFWKHIIGSYNHNGVRYKQNEVFEADATEIPKGALDVIRRCNEDGTIWVAPIKKAKGVTYKIVPTAASNTWFNVIASTGETVNDRLIPKVDADQLLKELTKDEK